MDHYPSLQTEFSLPTEWQILKEAIQVFEAGNDALLMGEYDLASECYEHVIRRGLAGREVYNNQGVALAQMAIALWAR